MQLIIPPTGQGNPQVQVTINGPITGLIMAHLHHGNATTNGPVVLGLMPIIDGPNVAALNPALSTTGQLSFITMFTEADLKTWDPNFGMRHLKHAVLNGNLYANVHTVANPDGEIRGQLAQLATR